MPEQADRNDPQNYPYLQRLLAETPPKEFNSLVLRRYRDAVTAALDTPPGSARQSLLNALDSGVASALRVHELRGQVADLQEVLQAQSPEMSRMLKTLEVIKLHTKSLHTKFKQVWDREKKEGRDPGKTSWAWFDHELHAGTAAIEFTAKALVVPAPAPDAADSA